MSLKLSSLAIDGESETDGIWVEFGDGDNVCEFKIARLHNPGCENYVAKLHERRKKWNRSIESDRSHSIKAYARHVLKGWRDLTDDDGNDIPFSIDAAEKILTDYPDVREFVTEVALDNEQFRLEGKMDAEGN